MKYVLLFTVCFVHFSFSQNVRLEAYFFESGNRGYLNQVSYEIKNERTGQLISEGYSNLEGAIKCFLPAKQKYVITASKSGFKDLEQSFNTDIADSKNVFLSLEMFRKPGYIFEATLAPARDSDEPVDALSGAKVEIYNNTTKLEELIVAQLSGYTFSHALEPGNHYSILIRKKGYYNKRIEVYVDVEGCILCFEGTGKITPGVVDNLTEGLKMGSLLSNIEMRPIVLGKGIIIPKIYYDYDKWDIRDDARPVLDNLIRLLRNNPALIVEMGSHTDSRGKIEYNRELSEKRAESVVEYLLGKGNIPEDRLSAYGYGESQIRNRCSDGVPCSEKEHQENRRTEMKVVGILDYDPYLKLSLADIIRKEKADQQIKDWIEGKSEQVQVSSFDELPQEIKNDILKNSQKKDSQENENVEPGIPDSEEIIIENELKSIEKYTSQVPNFSKDDNGYTIKLPLLPGSTKTKEEELLKNQKPVFRTETERYYIGLFDKKRNAKRLMKKLSVKYPSLEIVEILDGEIQL
jgi:outer membrane protein OmpA-like peptidoglycan-associated protein